MIVYVLLCYYDDQIEMHGVFFSANGATKHAINMENLNQVDKGAWYLKQEIIQP